MIWGYGLRTIKNLAFIAGLTIFSHFIVNFAILPAAVSHGEFS